MLESYNFGGSKSLRTGRPVVRTTHNELYSKSFVVELYQFPMSTISGGLNNLASTRDHGLCPSRYEFPEFYYPKGAGQEAVDCLLPV